MLPVVSNILYLDIHEGKLEFDLNICTWPASRICLQRPLKWPDIIFDVRIEIMTLKNLYFDMHEDILEFDLHICTWPASRIGHQWPPSCLAVFLMK